MHPDDSTPPLAEPHNATPTDPSTPSAPPADESPATGSPTDSPDPATQSAETPVAVEDVHTPAAEEPSHALSDDAPADAEPIDDVPAEDSPAMLLTASHDSPIGDAPAAHAIEEAPAIAPQDEAPVEETFAEEAEPVHDLEPAPVEVASPAEPEPEPDKKNWYIVKVQSNQEDSIKAKILRKVKIEGLEEFFDQILVPTEKVTELRNGKRIVKSRKLYPGYLMAHVEYNDKIQYLFRDTPGVGDFVGATLTRAPNPMPAAEVERMLAAHEANKIVPGKGGKEVAPVGKVKLNFDKGDRVRVRDGTFTGMEGEVKEIMEPKDAKDTYKVRIELQIFGRPVPVEVEVWQVETV